MIVKVEKESLHQGPERNEDIVAEADYGSILLILEVKGDWLKVLNNEGVFGWLSKESVWP